MNGIIKKLCTELDMQIFTVPPHRNQYADCALTVVKYNKSDLARIVQTDYDDIAHSVAVIKTICILWQEIASR